MIKVSPSTYRAFWIACLLLALFLLVPGAAMLWLAVTDIVSLAMNVVAFWAIVASTFIGAILMALAIRRLARPLRVSSQN